MNDNSKKLLDLRAQLIELKSDFSNRVNELERKIDFLQTNGVASTPDSSETVSKLGHEESLEQPSAQLMPSVGSEPMKVTAVLEDNVPESDKASVIQKKQQSAKAEQPIKSPKPSVFTTLFRRLVTFILEQFGFRAVVEQAVDYVKQQQQQGKLPVLLLTASGIVILVIALGYLGQYTFNQFTPALKVSSGYLIAMAVFVLSMVLRFKTQTALSFVTALCGLSLLIAYLSSYFLGPYFQLAGAFTTLLVFSIITCVGYVVSYRLDTKILAIISLLGGIGLPWLSGAPELLTVTYTAYLLLLNLATLRISLVLKAPSLTYLTISLTPLILQYQLLSHTAASPYFLILLHGFFFLYTAIIGINATQKVTAKLLSLFVANLTFYSVSVVQWYQSQSNELSPLPFAIAASVFVVGAIFSLKIRHQLYYVLTVLHGGVLIALAAISWAGFDGSGVIWAIEALLLLFLGIKYEERLIRNEAYILFIVSLILNAISVLSWLFGASTIFWNIETGYFVSVGLTAQCLIVMARKMPVKLAAYEMTYFYLLKELVSFWIICAILLLSFLFIPKWTLVSASLPVFILLYRHIRHDLPVSLLLVALSFILLLSQIPLTIQEVGSRHFSDFTWPGRVASILSFGFLLLVPQFYLKNLPKGKLVDVMSFFQTLFWLALPLIFLRSAYRHFPEWFAVILWLSVGISWMIYSRFKLKRYGVALLLLVVVTFLFALVSALLALINFENNSGSLAILIGIVFFTAVIHFNQSFQLVRQRSTQRLPIIQTLASLGHYFVPVGVTALFFGIFEQVWLSFLLLVGFSSIIILKWPKMGALRHRAMSHLIVQFIGLWLLSLMTLITIGVSDFSYGLIFAGVTHVSLLGYFMHGPLYYRRLLIGVLSTQSMSYAFFQTLIVFTYWIILYKLTDNSFGVLLSGSLVLHAVTLLFVAKQKVIRVFERLGLILFLCSMLKIFLFDMREFSMIHKVAGFSVIGVFLLLAAFQYQKSKPAELFTRKNKDLS